MSRATIPQRQTPRRLCPSWLLRPPCWGQCGGLGCLYIEAALESDGGQALGSLWAAWHRHSRGPRFCWHPLGHETKMTTKMMYGATTGQSPQSLPGREGHFPECGVRFRAFASLISGIITSGGGAGSPLLSGSGRRGGLLASHRREVGRCTCTQSPGTWKATWRAQGNSLEKSIAGPFLHPHVSLVFFHLYHQLVHGVWMYLLPAPPSFPIEE